MTQRTAGIHHITAIVGHPQENVDFYAGVLGLRLVKKTINFDDPETYHLYFGDESASPGTIITFFPWENGRRGEIGGGQVGVTSYAVPIGALKFWESRLTEMGVVYKKMTRFHEDVLQFTDPHGLQLEIVERAGADLHDWPQSEIDKEVAIKGFAGATLYSTAPEETAKTLTNVMGLTHTETEGDYMRFVALADIGNVVDVKMISDKMGTMGVGTVHHIAWRATDEIDHLAWQKNVQQQGFHVTDIRDRNYFKALYFREPGHVLFEIATDSPGFVHDESFATMGETLKLPKQYENRREQLEERLIPIKVPNMNK